MLEYCVVPVTSFYQNCSIVWDSTNNISAIIDPGGDLDCIVSIIQQKKLYPNNIFLTHAHLDHASMAGVLSKMLGIPIIGPQKDDIFWLKQMNEQCKLYGFPIPSEPCNPDHFVTDSELYYVGNEFLQVIHCPGHTPGHVAYYNQSSSLLFVGDILFKNSIGRCDFPMSNYSLLIKNIRSKLFTLPGNTCFIPGHGPFSFLDSERLTNPFVADHLFKNETQ